MTKPRRHSCLLIQLPITVVFPAMSNWHFSVEKILLQANLLSIVGAGTPSHSLQNQFFTPPTWIMRCSLLATLLIATLLLPLAEAAPPNGNSGFAATLVVATSNSSKRSRDAADFVGDGVGDQEEINAAVNALPAAGGTVTLMEGTYDIRKIPDTLGGVLIERSNVTIAGQGTATKLVLAPNQNTNVIRIIGSGVGHITIRDLFIDANREMNSNGKGDPNVSHARFEFCGIKAFSSAPSGPTAEPNHDITVRNCHVLNSQRLGIMLEGSNMRVIDNVLGNAGSDVVEILTGPGMIRGNIVEITGQTHVAIGSDRGNSITMTDNIVRVKKGGKLDIGFRSWADSRRHVIANNVLVVDPGGRCTLAMDVRGTGSTITGNSLYGSDQAKKMQLKVTGGLTTMIGNLLENVDVLVSDQTGEGHPVVIEHNLLNNSEVDIP